MKLKVIRQKKLTPKNGISFNFSLFSKAYRANIFQDNSLLLLFN
ncbi:hypothetical protein HMPREF0653_01929 [Prevotella disiens JCM 6334 = ATCC 29426]|uniref:Uncharacterized protein n=1 Tax=Prevotella disiens JCM 6334 = ATCC 29426 TaxID=1235811 RepID=A0ABN0NQH5_9BACT|nr:hypothetical protein HMPREF0653_01929 [Prevotella disiens JCM 6334 = ATCC 29426]